MADEFDMKKIEGKTILNLMSGCEIKEISKGEVNSIGKSFPLNMK